MSRRGPLLRRWLLGAAALMFAAGSAAAQVAYPELTVSGEILANGIFDPSVEYDGAGTTGWLVYSSVYGDVTPWGPHVETHLARSDDRGASWSFVQVVNPSTDGSLTLPGQPDLEGVWNAEVASLVHDPDDPGREWKVFAHRIFRKSEDGFEGEQNVPSHSWIALRSAADPAGTWSAERALLSSGPLPPAPYDAVEVAINALDPSLADLLVYSEPGAFYRDGVLYLSLTGLSLDGPDRIVLLASDDHGDSWRYVSSPLANSDAQALGWETFDGSAIAAEGGRVFLLVSPGTPSLLHDGTLVFEFEDLAAGRLVREGGVPAVRKHVPLQPAFASERGAGQSDFHEYNTAGGLLMPQINLPDFPRFFQIFETGERLLGAEPVPAAGGAARGLTALCLLWAIRSRARRAAPGRARAEGVGFPARRRPGSAVLPSPDPGMSSSEATTQGIRVEVESRHDPERSRPGLWFFLYTVRISNLGDETVQLMSRHWIIRDANGRVDEVQGPGVVGDQPILEPGQTYEYTSGCPLRTPFGSMLGSYQMVTTDGEQFDAEIAEFLLREPGSIH